MKQPLAILERLPEIAPHLVDITDPPLGYPVLNDDGSERQIGSDEIVARLGQMTEVYKETRNTMFIGEYEDRFRAPLRDGVRILTKLGALGTETSFYTLPDEVTLNLGRAVADFIPRAIHASFDLLQRNPIILGREYGRAHVQMHVDSYRALLPYTGFAVRRHIRRQLKS